MTTDITITVPLAPHPYLNPNSGKHKRTREPYKDAYKEAAAAATTNTLRGATWAHTGPIMAHVEIYWPSSHSKRLDFDNAIASTKHAIDGIFAKIEANDRQIIGMTLVQDRDPNRMGYTVIRLEPLTQEGREAA